MDTVFLSYHFDPEPRLWAAYVESLVQSHGLKVETGEHLAGGQLTQTVKEKIDAADALIYLLTKRDEGKTNDWVKLEAALAYEQGKPLIGLIENGVAPIAPLQSYEYIPFEDINSVDLWIKLSTTLGEWKFRSGRTVVAILEPDEVAESIEEAGIDYAAVEYRTYDPQFNKTDWKPGMLKSTPGGVSVRLPGIQSDNDIEIRVTTPRQTWRSKVINQTLRVALQHA